MYFSHWCHDISLWLRSQQLCVRGRASALESPDCEKSQELLWWEFVTGLWHLHLQLCVKTALYYMPARRSNPSPVKTRDGTGLVSRCRDATRDHHDSGSCHECDYLRPVPPKKQKSHPKGTKGFRSGRFLQKVGYAKLILVLRAGFEQSVNQLQTVSFSFNPPLDSLI